MREIESEPNNLGVILGTSPAFLDFLKGQGFDSHKIESLTGVEQDHIVSFVKDGLDVLERLDGMVKYIPEDCDVGVIRNLVWFFGNFSKNELKKYNIDVESVVTLRAIEIPTLIIKKYIIKRLNKRKWKIHKTNKDKWFKERNFSKLDYTGFDDDLGFYFDNYTNLGQEIVNLSKNPLSNHFLEEFKSDKWLVGSPFLADLKDGYALSPLIPYNVPLRALEIKSFGIFSRESFTC